MMYRVHSGPKSGKLDAMGEGTSVSTTRILLARHDRGLLWTHLPAPHSWIDWHNVVSLPLAHHSSTPGRG